MPGTQVTVTSAALFVVIVVSSWGIAPALPLAAAQSQVGVSALSAPLRKVIASVEPEYPPEALRLGIEADINLEVVVNAAGAVTNTEPSPAGGTMLHHDDQNVSERAEFVANHANAFRDAAVAAARQWKFEPGTTQWTCVFSFQFRLKPPDSSQAKKAARTSLESPTPSAISGSARPGEVVPTPSTRRVRVGGDVKVPHKIADVKPLYPDDARAVRAKGVVLLEVTIASNGSVSNARVLRSIPLFDQAAIDAVTQWKFEPTVLNGAPAEVEMLVYINFVPPSE